MSRVNCLAHCATCGSHFHSEKAFAAHRVGGFCEEPADVKRLTVLSDEGICELARVPYTPLEPGNRQVYPSGWQSSDPPVQRVIRPVTIWMHR